MAEKTYGDKQTAMNDRKERRSVRNVKVRRIKL